MHIKDKKGILSWFFLGGLIYTFLAVLFVYLHLAYMQEINLEKLPEDACIGLIQNGDEILITDEQAMIFFPGEEVKTYQDHLYIRINKMCSTEAYADKMHCIIYYDVSRDDLERRPNDNEIQKECLLKNGLNEIKVRAAHKYCLSFEGLSGTRFEIKSFSLSPSRNIITELLFFGSIFWGIWIAVYIACSRIGFRYESSAKTFVRLFEGAMCCILGITLLYSLSGYRYFIAIIPMVALVLFFILSENVCVGGGTR